MELSVRRGCLLLTALTEECLFLIPTKALQGSGLIQCSKGPACTSPHTSTCQGPPCPQLASRVETQCREQAREATPLSPEVHGTPKPALAKDRNYLGYVGAKAGGPSDIPGPVPHLLWPGRPHWPAGTGGSHFKAPFLS